jgi:hypothetical protein
MLQNIHDTYWHHLSFRMIRVNIFSVFVHERKNEKMTERVKEGRKERKEHQPMQGENYILLCAPDTMNMQSEFFVRFEVFTAVTMKNAVFWDVALCNAIRRSCCRSEPIFHTKNYPLLYNTR